MKTLKRGILDLVEVGGGWVGGGGQLWILSGLCGGAKGLNPDPGGTSYSGGVAAAD